MKKIVGLILVVVILIGGFLFYRLVRDSLFSSLGEEGKKVSDAKEKANQVRIYNYATAVYTAYQYYLLQNLEEPRQFSDYQSLIVTDDPVVCEEVGIENQKVVLRRCLLEGKEYQYENGKVTIAES